MGLSKGTGDVTVSIPASIAERIADRIKGTEFVSVDAYVTYVLQELLVPERGEEEAFSPEEEERIKERLRALGYLE